MASVLILCTGNSCRSQMAEGFLKNFDSTWQVFSAGTRPTAEVHPLAIKAMGELDIDISHHHPKSVDTFLSQDFDYVITVCDHARETCPFFAGSVKNRLHIGFEDPAEAEGAEEEIFNVFRSVRDEMKDRLKSFYDSAENG